MAVYYFRNAGVNWGDAANWSLTDGGGATGAVPTAADDALFTANSGNCTVNASNRVCKTLDFTGYTNTITMTFNITVSGNVTLAAGMGIAGTGTLIVNATSTLTSNGKTWSANLSLITNATTHTLADNWTISGILTINGGFGGVITINSNTIYSSGNLVIEQPCSVNGTTTIELTGGTWSYTSSGSLNTNVNLNGNVTLSGTLRIANNTLNYISGLITTTNSSFLCTSSILSNVSTINWNNFSFAVTSTLQSDINIYGLASLAGTFNGSFNINCYNGLSSGNSVQGTGSPIVNIYGGNCTTGSSFANSLRLNTFIRGNIRLTGLYFYFYERTITYVTGKIEQESGNSFFLSTGTFINFDKVNLKNIRIDAGATITMNRFFSGSALIPTRIQSHTTVNYNITFQDGFEKITKFTKISNCTVTNRGQLLCITDKSNKGGNVGIRYINQSPNGIAKNANSVLNPLGYPAPTFLAADPNFIIN